MGYLIPCGLAILLAGGFASAQQTMREADLRTAAAPPVPWQTGSARDNEIRDLKVAISQLQERVDRLSASPGCTVGRLPPVQPVANPSLLERLPDDANPSIKAGNLPAYAIGGS